MAKQRDVVLQWLRELIVRGELGKPGELFKEAELVERFSKSRTPISRTPITQALAILAEEGLIEQRPQVGATVRRVPAEEFAQLVKIRIALEGMTAMELATMTDSDRLDGLEELLHRMESCAQTGDKAGFNSADAKFHYRIDVNSRLSRAADLLQTARDQTVRIFGVDALQVEGTMEDVLDEHRAIFHAIEDGKVEEAREAVETHLKRYAERMAAIDPEQFGTVDQLVNRGRHSDVPIEAS